VRGEADEPRGKERDDGESCWCIICEGGDKLIACCLYEYGECPRDVWRTYLPRYLVSALHR
jgi:hypothetical protein